MLDGFAGQLVPAPGPTPATPGSSAVTRCETQTAGAIDCGGGTTGPNYSSGEVSGTAIIAGQTTLVDDLCMSRPHCSGDADCADGNPCTTDRCDLGLGRCSFDPVVCTPPDACHDVGTCDSGTGQCSNPVKPDGTTCDDGNLCTQSDVCEAGLCTGTEPVLCTPVDSCHDAGTCDPTTGQCSNPVKPDGTTCDDGDLCTSSDMCEASVCVGTPKDCSVADACHDAGACNPATGLCPDPKPNGTPCDDGDLCTATDQCQASICVGTPKDCSVADACHDAGECNPATGLCPNPKPDGTSCDDRDLCTTTDLCQASICVGTPKDCSVADACHDAGECNPATGLCPNPKPDGTSCDDRDLCTTTDLCQASICVGAPKDCSVADACHDAGECNPATGLCPNPKPDETPCDDDNRCTQSDSCLAGLCTGTDPVLCMALDSCHEAGTCDSATGQCSNPTKPDDSPCDDGNLCTSNDMCQAGICVGTPEPDSTRVLAYVANSDDDTVSVIDTSDNAVVQTISLVEPGQRSGLKPQNVALKPPGTSSAAPLDGQVFVTNQGAAGASISVIDTATNTLVDTINPLVPNNGGTLGLALSADGIFLYVANVSAGVLFRIDTSINKPCATQPAPECKATTRSLIRPYGIAISPDGSRVYVTNSLVGGVVVFNAERFDDPLGAFERVIDVAPGHGVAVTRSGGKDVVLVAHPLGGVSVIDTSACDTPVRGCEVTHALEVSSSEAVAVAPADDTCDLELRTCVHDGARACATDLDCCSKCYAYVTNPMGQTVSVIDTTLAVSDPNNAVVAILPLMGRPFGVAFTPDGQTAYVTSVTNRRQGMVWPIDAMKAPTGTDAVGPPIDVGADPRGIAVGSVRCGSP
jgi:YVTN family beta-propeller protein